MKFYIATSLNRMQDHNLVRDCLLFYGHKITYDWTEHGNVKESAKRLKEVALGEFGGIGLADFIVVLLPGGRGTHTELGLALGFDRKVFIHGPDELFEPGAATCAFYHLPNLRRIRCDLHSLASNIEMYFMMND